MQSEAVKIRNYRAINNFEQNKIHALFRYPAKLIPEIPYAFLVEEKDKDKKILDPFCGSGTVMIETQRLGFSSIGIDINPLSTFITKVKTTPLPWELVTEYQESFLMEINDTDDTSPSFPNKDYWFLPNIEKALAKIRSWLHEKKHEINLDVHDFLAFSFAGLIRKYSNADNHIFPPVKKLEKAKNLEKISEQQIFTEYIEKVRYNMRVLKAYFKQIEEQHGFISEVNTITDSASNKVLPDNSVDYIITSPPYINAQKYLRTTKF